MLEVCTLYFGGVFFSIVESRIDLSMVLVCMRRVRRSGFNKKNSRNLEGVV